MPLSDSDYVFESGQGIRVGEHGTNDFLFHSGDPVLDLNSSNIVFEAGSGLGGSTSFRAILRDGPGGSVISDITASDTDGLYGAGGFGMVWNPDVNLNPAAWWDNFQLTDGTVIDDFSDGNLSEYEQDTEIFTVSGGRAAAGDVSGTDPTGGASAFIYSEPGGGLNYYPKPGDDWTYEIEFTSGATVVGNVFGVQRSGKENSGYVAPYDNNEPNSLEVSPRPGNGDFIIRKWEDATGNILASDSSMNWNNYTNQVLEVEVRWR